MLTVTQNGRKCYAEEIKKNPFYEKETLTKP